MENMWGQVPGLQPKLFLLSRLDTRTLCVRQWAGVGAAWPGFLSPEVKVLLRGQSRA